MLGFSPLATAALATIGETSTVVVPTAATELNTMDGITATTAELNYTDGVTSNIQTTYGGSNPISLSEYHRGGNGVNGYARLIVDGTSNAFTSSGTLVI